ncbi:MAG TPA: DUF4339 domain-containing protein [Pirellulales bacterium]|nr:DUF4339 domain-containing protein [Pirellulales bacterium]
MAEIQWWYARDDEQLGPLSPGELRRLAAGGGLAPTDLVWREGMNEWAPAARIKGLFPESREAADEPLGSQSVAPSAPATGPSSGIGKQAELSAPPPEPTMPPESSPGEMFGGDLPNGGGTRPGPIESGLFRTVDSATAEASFATERDTAAARKPSRIPLVLFLVRGVLWGTCGLVVLLGGLLFSMARLRGTSPTEEAASATVLGMFFIGAYVVAQAGEKISQLVLSFVERRRED